MPVIDHEIVNRFVTLGCVQYNGQDNVGRYKQAEKLLEENPGLASASFHAALVANDKEAVERFLQIDPTLAASVDGPMNWPALMYVTYSRVGLDSGQVPAIDIVKQLLALGGNPDAHVVLQDNYRFTVLTGALGEGEMGQHQPPHSQAASLVNMLLEAGASANEGQGLYNTMLDGGVDHWLPILVKAGLNGQHLINWQASAEDEPVRTLDFLLANAVGTNKPERVKYLLKMGADACCSDTYTGRSIHTLAVLRGNDSIAELLLAAGACSETLSLQDRFRLACVNARQDDIAQMAGEHPELMTDATLLHDAAFHAIPSVYHYLIKLGFDIDSKTNGGRTLLHHFALQNNVEQVKYLVECGANADVLDDTYSSTPLGFATHVGSDDVAQYLVQHSNNLPESAG